MREGADNEFGLSNFRGCLNLRVIRYLSMMPGDASGIESVCPRFRIGESLWALDFTTYTVYQAWNRFEMKIRGDSSNDVPVKLQEALEYMPQAIGYASGYQLGGGIHHTIVLDRIQGWGET